MSRLSSLTIAILIVTVSVSNARPFSDVQPPGPYFKLAPEAHTRATTFQHGQPTVATSFFYWYDAFTGMHFRNNDGTDALTLHPKATVTVETSYRLPEWHHLQLREMTTAGIDVVLPVYWGIPGQYDKWSFAGLGPLVAAHDRLLAEREENGALPPKIGLFYDTSTLQYNSTPNRKNRQIDLTTPAGREWFYVTIRDFWSMIPPDKWARIDGKPLILLYSAQFAAAVDAKVYNEARRCFKADFGTDFFLVRHRDWPEPSDAWYQWGGSCGLTLGDHVAGLGPGYDHSAVPGRKPLVVDRENGAFYDRQWSKLLAMPPGRRPWLVHLETWNEWHEATSIARSKEHGDRALRSTAKFSRMFHQKLQLPKNGPFLRAKRVRWSTDAIAGLTLLPSGGDGYWKHTTFDGVQAITTIANPKGVSGQYLYFDVDDSYLFGEVDTMAEVTVVYRDDGGCDRFIVQYDNNDPNIGTRAGAFRPTRHVTVGKTNTWRTATLQLPDVRFVNRANNADLRLAPIGGEHHLTIREVILRRIGGRPVTLSQPAP